MYRCAVNKNEETNKSGYRKVVKIAPSQSQKGDVLDKDGNYLYTYLDFDFEVVPPISAEVSAWLGEKPLERMDTKLFKAKLGEILARTIVELQVGK